MVNEGVEESLWFIKCVQKKGTRESGVPIFKGNHLGVIIYRITSVCRIVGENMHENTDGIDCFY